MEASLHTNLCTNTFPNGIGFLLEVARSMSEMGQHILVVRVTTVIRRESLSEYLPAWVGMPSYIDQHSASGSVTPLLSRHLGTVGIILMLGLMM